MNVLRPLPAVFLIACVFAGAAIAHADDAPNAKLFLEGQFLVAAKKMPDPRFAKSVILMADHDPKGAFGFVINKVFGKGPLASLLEGFGVKDAASTEVVELHYGGPVELNSVAVLHGNDYSDSSTKRIGADLAWSNDRAVLEAIAAGKGPKERLFIVGYAGWSAGQLEQELARDDWLSAPADATLIFGADPDTLWDRVMAKAGLKL